MNEKPKIDRWVAITGIITIGAIVVIFAFMGINGKVALGGGLLIGFIVRGFIPKIRFPKMGG